MTDSGFEPIVPVRNPATQRQTRRQIWLQIYLPFAIGLAVIAASAAVLWNSGRGAAGAWSDAAAILLLLPLLLALLLPLALVVAAFVGATLLIQRLPPLFYRAQREIERVGVQARQIMKQPTRPLVAAHALRAGLRRAVDHLISTFRRESNYLS